MKPFNPLLKRISVLPSIFLLVGFILGAAGCALNSNADASGSQNASGNPPSSSPQPAQTESTEGVKNPPAPTESLSTPATPLKETREPLTCSVVNGTYFRQKIETSVLPGTFYFSVYLPPCYSSSGESYPVIYLMHGISYSDDQWKRLGIVTAADHLISTGVIPPVVIIMPYNYDWRQPDESNFGLVVTNVLVPWVDENYHTLADREHRAIGGLSRGAGWAVHLGLTRWDLFSRIGAHSLSLLRVDESKLDDLFSAVPEDQKPEFYLDAGNQDPELVNIDHFIQQLETRKFPYQWSINPGTHNENYWGAHVTEYLLWYVQQW